MYRNRLINSIFLFLTVTCAIEGENPPFVYDFFPYPEEFSQTGFRPENLQIGIDDRKYFLDTHPKTIGIIEEEIIKWVGGFEFENDEFITPVSMAYSNLSLFVLDQSQSKVTEFDSNLNFISSFALNINYPDLIIFNPLNETVIFSNSEQTMIDLNQYPQISGEVLNRNIQPTMSPLVLPGAEMNHFLKEKCI